MDIKDHFYWNTAKSSLVIISTLTGEDVEPKYLTNLIAVPAPPAGNDWIWDVENTSWTQRND